MKMNPEETAGQQGSKAFLKNGSYLFKKEVWEKINGYDGRMIDGYADHDFINRAEAGGFTVKTIEIKN